MEDTFFYKKNRGTPKAHVRREFLDISQRYIDSIFDIHTTSKDVYELPTYLTRHVSQRINMRRKRLFDAFYISPDDFVHRKSPILLVVFKK